MGTLLNQPRVWIASRGPCDACRYISICIILYCYVLGWPNKKHILFFNSSPSKMQNKMVYYGIVRTNLTNLENQKIKFILQPKIYIKLLLSHRFSKYAFIVSNLNFKLERRNSKNAIPLSPCHHIGRVRVQRFSWF